MTMGLQSRLTALLARLSQLRRLAGTCLPLPNSLGGLRWLLGISTASRTQLLPLGQLVHQFRLEHCAAQLRRLLGMSALLSASWLAQPMPVPNPLGLRPRGQRILIIQSPGRSVPGNPVFAVV